MGAYLAQPNTEKISHDESHEGLSFGVSAMQGWRMAMEDAHCSLINFDENQNSLFGVFDGHGGKEVAEYCAQNIHKFLLDSESYQENEIHKALKLSFMAIDEAVTSDEVIEELKTLGGIDQCNEEEEAAMLLEEANLPIEELLERMKGNVKEKLIENGIHQEESDLDEQGIKLNGQTGDNDENAEETDTNDSNSGRSRKQKKPVKRSVDGDKNKKDDSSTAGTSNCSEAECSSDTAGQSGGSGSSSSRKVLAESSSTDNLLPAAGSSSGSENTADSSNDIKETTAKDADSDYKEKEESEDDSDDDDEDGDSDSEESDSDDEFEDSEGVEFQQGSDEVGKDSGTTAIVALIHNKKLYVANVGDSRCVLCRNGKPVDMSIDHKPEDEVEKKRIEKAGGKITMDGRVNGGLNLSRAIGDHAYKQNKDMSPEEQLITACPDIKEIELTKDDDFMVLACDGIWNMMTSEEVVEFINERLRVTDEKAKLSKICEELFDRCLAPDTENDGSGCDNMTCLIVRFKHNAAAGVRGEGTSRLKRPLDDDHKQSKDSKKTKLTSMD